MRYSFQILVVALLGLAGLLPVFSHNGFLVNTMILFFIFAIFAASWDLVFGYAGQLSFGQTFPYGVAGFVSALLVTYYPATGKSLVRTYLVFGMQVSPFIALIIGAAVATVLSLLLTLPSLRLRRDALIIVTIAIPVAAQLIFIQIWGEEGIPQVPLLVPTREQFYFVALGVAAFVYLSLYFLTRSRIGLRFKAIREDELAAAASGLNTVYYKVLAFSLSAFYAGLAGGLFTFFTSDADQSMFSLVLMFQIVAMTILGGEGTLLGPLVGSLILTFASSYLQYIPALNLLIYSIVVILTILFLPKGILKPILDLRRKRSLTNVTKNKS